MRLDEILGRLEGVTGGATGQWSARCPGHDDRHASLTISEGDDGRVILHCFADCELDAICAGMGVEIRDLFPSKDELALTGGSNGKRAPWGNRPLGEADLPMPGELDRFVRSLLDDGAMLGLVWERKGWKGSTLASLGIGLVGDRLSIPVKDPAGKIVNHLRYKPNGNPKMLASKGRPRTPLYFTVEDQEAVWIVEGETDAISLAMLGFSVIGAPGASAKARPEWLDFVRGRHVIVCMDNDKPGRSAANRWAHAATTAGALDVKVVTLEGPEGFDVGELVRQGRDKREAVRAGLLDLADDAELYGENVVKGEAPTPAADNSDLEPGAMVLTQLVSVRVERMRWRWYGRIPVGRVGIVFGPPGQGKSTFTALLTSNVTRDGERVLIASAEDDPATTIKPRLLAAGAVMERVALISTKTAKGDTGLVLPRDLDALAASMANAGLLIIDPFSAHLGDDVNAWSEQSVRSQVLAPLAWHARFTDCTVVLIMHINKSDRGDALSRISGSGGFGGAARFALLLGTHPDDVAEDELNERLVLAHVKASEGQRQPAMIFRRQPVAVDVGDGEEPALIPVLDLVDDRSLIDVDRVLERTDPEERGAYTDALVWLKRELVNGPILAKRLLSSARERGDFSERTLRKAKRALGVRSERESDGWFWILDPPRGGT